MPMYGGFGNEGFGNGGGGGDGAYVNPFARRKAETEAREPRVPKGTPKSRLIKCIVITVIFAAAYFYFELPAINIHDPGFLWFVGLTFAVFCICVLLFNCVAVTEDPVGALSYVKKNLKVPVCIIIAMIAIFIVGSLAGWAVFRAKAYSQLITVETGDFAAEVEEITWSQIPMLDASSANNLANRKLGELSDLVSQFAVNSNSSQINYQGAPIRTVYLDYGGFFKWVNNVSSGIPAYMRIDMRTQEVTVVRLDEGIKYSPSEYFFRDVERYLRFSYPTFIFDDINFEIDENGTPYWVASVVTRKIGLFSGTDVKGAVLLNAQTGEHVYYDVADVPTWVDRVYSADLVVEQYDYYGIYHNGFWNSVFGQSDCTETTSGYNYIAQDDDVWLYTGITSVTGDQGNIGFILVNQRTKEAHYYSCAGAEEYSAMSSAEGAVQQYSYQATFPLLLNISEQPTYFMALKDDAGLVKMYAMVNVQQYQIVATGSTVSACQHSYKELLAENDLISSSEVGTEGDEEGGVMMDATGKIEEIRSAIIDGNTVFYFKLKGGDVFYAVKASEYPEAVILDVGDEITVEYSENAAGKLIDAVIKE